MYVALSIIIPTLLYQKEMNELTKVNKVGRKINNVKLFLPFDCSKHNLYN